eukprot:gene32566-36771_t
MMQELSAELTQPAPPERFALTMGDPSGIGPEIVARTLLNAEWARRCVLVGDPRVMRQALLAARALRHRRHAVRAGPWTSRSRRRGTEHRQRHQPGHRDHQFPGLQSRLRAERQGRQALMLISLPMRPSADRMALGLRPEP